jgi:hypothetical protein
VTHVFQLRKLWSLPGETKHYVGLAKLEDRSVVFTLFIGDGLLLMWSQAGSDGLKLIEHFSNLIGGPSTVTTDKRYGYVEYCARWRITATVEEDILKTLLSEIPFPVPRGNSDEVAQRAFTYL